MLIAFEQVCILFVFALAGYILGKLKLANTSHTQLLSSLEVYVFLPCTVFSTFAVNFTVPYITEKYQMILLCAVSLALLVPASRFVANRLSKDAFERDVFRYSITVPNFGYMGYALALGMFGSEALLNMVIFGLPVTIYVYTAGFCMLTRSKFRLKMLAQPVLIAMMLGCVVGLFQIPMPNVVNEIITRSSNCMGPIGMLLTGIAVSEFSIRPLLTKWKLYLITVLRILVVPILIAGALSLFCGREVVMSALLVYAMPCGLNTVVFPRLIGESCENGAGLALISSVLSCLTIPICFAIFL